MKLKKLFALLLCVCMLLSVLPMGALAALLSLDDPAPAQDGDGGFLTVDEGDGNAAPGSEDGGFLTVDNGDGNAAPGDDDGGFLTVDNGDGNAAPGNEDGGFLTVDGGDDDDDDDDGDDLPWQATTPGATQVYVCEWCGWTDGYHADDCPSHVDEEPEEPAQPADGESEEPKPDKSEVRAYAPAANTFADIFDALLEAGDLDEYEAILNELDEEQQALFFDLLDGDELAALEAVEADLAYAAVETFSLRDTTRSSVSLDVAVQSMSAALREAMQELADRLGARVASMLGKSSITLRAFTLPEDRCTAVEAFASRSETHDYQWQILAGEDADGEALWANILGAEGKQLLVTYAMVANLLDGDDRAELRCVIDGEPTDATIAATVDYNYRALWDAEDEEIEDGETEDESFGDEIIGDGISTFALTGDVAMLNAGESGIQTYADTTDGDSSTNSDVKKTYSIVVKYQFTDGTTASQEWTATVTEGSDFNQTVTFPTVQGYLPYVNNEQRNSIELNYPSVSKDETVTVTYQPTQVDYTVVHYQQNVGDDDYTIKDTETKTGLTGSKVGFDSTHESDEECRENLAKSYEGFYSLLFETPPIAADGSTRIEIYYDRYYYLMNFDMGGGYGTEPVYARCGADIGTVADPFRAGYTFKGWSETKDGTEPVELPETMPVGGATYYAIWEANDTAKVTIVFWGENANDEDYSYLKDYTKVVYLKPGREFTYSETKMQVCDREPHAHTADCIGCGKTPHTHDESCGELNCEYEDHIHTDACYNGHRHGVGCYSGASSSAKPLNPPDNPKNGQVYSGSVWFVDYSYVYINGSWYNYSGSVANGSTVSPSCGLTEVTEPTCGKEETHFHSKDCYSNVGSEQWTAPDGAPGSPAQGQVCEVTKYFFSWSYTEKYIYLDGSWYGYTGDTAAGEIAATTCGHTTHVHTDACYTDCSIPVHTHNESCYSCGKVEHSHTDDCYLTGKSPDAEKWVFKESDTVTVAADGSTVVNVYYTRKTFTLHFRKANSNFDNYGTITDKWGANIRSRFEAKNKQADTALWSEKQNGNSPWTGFLDVMPSKDVFYYANSANGSTHTAVYYGEPVSGTELETLYTSNVKYSGNLTVNDKDKVEIEGFTYVDTLRFNNRTYSSTANSSSFNGAKFYYTRNSYTLTFNNQYENVKEESVKYEASLSTYKDYKPTAPNYYPDGTVTFGGWYQNPQCTGDEYKLAEHTMPASDVILYAKWVPVKMKVNFYLDKAAYDAGTGIEDYTGIEVGYGSLLESDKVPPADNENYNGSYQFDGWFYMEDGKEKAFDFNTMSVTKDLDVYGKWSSNVLRSYTVQYVLAENVNGEIVPQTGDDGQPIRVAKDDTGSGLAGTTKTFDAKGGTELYDLTAEGGANYQEGYFPTVQSQSLTLDIEGTAESLTVTFYYLQAPAVPYTVHYVTAATVDDDTTTYGTVNVDGQTYTRLAEDYKNNDNKKAVVTETFQPISGYRPDAYQKRLVVSVEADGTADTEKNVLYFIYTKDSEHAYYKITHYIQNLDGENWTEYSCNQMLGDIGTRYTADSMTIEGFTYERTEYKVNGSDATDVTTGGAKLTAAGLEINLYYVRNKYPYEIRHLAATPNADGTYDELADTESGTEMYGKVVSGTAKTIDGYEVDHVEPTSQTINISIEETATRNVITFYYKEKEVTINYVAVGPTDATNFGSVSPGSEPVKVKTGTAQGSTATANDGFRFVGWFSDEGCTEKVSENLAFAPTQPSDGKWVDATYYAKFEYDITSLTITKTWEGSATYHQDAVFTVSGNGKNVTVVIHPDTNGSGSVTINGLKVGSEYTVTEDTGWSWRYSSSSDKTDGKITLVATASDNTVTFTNTVANPKWLDANYRVENKLGADGNVTRNPAEPVTTAKKKKED